MPVWELRLLGPVELVRGGEPVDVGPPQRRLVLAALAVDAGRPVPVDTLIARVWGPAAPERGRRALQAHLARLRQAVEPAELIRRSGGYQLDAPPESVDIGRFHDLVRRARESERPVAERARLHQAAVELFHGEPLADLPGPWARQVRERWRRQHLDAVIGWARLAIPAGDAEAVLGHLTALVDEHPLVEPLAAAYMLALHAAGRTAESLDHFTKVRQRLVGDLGIEPGAELRQAQLTVLRGDQGRDRSGDREEPPGTSAPAQLPHEVTSFVGRAVELKRLDEMLDRNGTPAVATVAGTAGVGKTSLAVHWAHRVRDRFPDGQLYVNLAGFDPRGSPVTAAEAVSGFLVALGVPPPRVPSTLSERTALYRSLLAERQILIVLDNARNAEHARPLLPGTPRSLALVTSRDSLGGLIAQGAYPVMLEVLSARESGDLLDRRIGRPRTHAEPASVAEIAARCAGLPLALAVVAVRAATNPSFTLAAVAGELRDSRLALDALAAGDPASDVRAVLSWSYHALDAGAARLFRLLGLHGGPDVSAATAASLIGEPVRRTRMLLADLARVHLVLEHQPGRYGMHDLLRAYAAELAEAIDPPAERQQALRRVLDHFVHTGKAAALLLFPGREPMDPGPAAPGAVVEALDSYEQAEEWFATEHRAVLAAIRRSAELGLDQLIGRLAWTLTTFQLRRGLWHDWETAQRAALEAAQRRGDRGGEADAHRSLGRVLQRLGRLQDADLHYRRALQIYRRVGDADGEAITHDNLSPLLSLMGRAPDAVAHARRALELFRSVDHTLGMASASNSVAYLLVQVGEPAEAVGYALESLTLHRRIGDVDGEAATWDTLGFARHHLGEWSEAADNYRQALVLYRRLDDRYKIADTLRNQGTTQHASGDREAAGQSWREALSILEDIGHPEAEDVRAQLSQP